MKHILLITENLGSGGAERQLVGLAALLKEKGYDVTVVTYLEKQFHEKFLHEHNVEYIFAPQLLNRATRVGRLIKLFKELKPEVVISYLPQVNQSVCLARLFHKFHLIVSERSHTMNFGIRTRLQYLLYSKANYVVANSYSEAQNIKDHFPLLKKKTLAIPNFVETERFTLPLTKEVEKKDAPTRILCVGRVIVSKNVLRFLDVIADIIKDGYSVQCKWVGSMYDKAYCEQVKEKISSLNLQNVVTLQNQTNDIIEEYQKADIFCLPSLLEGYPNVLVEAMSCGLPVVCSNVFENPRIVQDSINGYLFDPKDNVSMGNAIKKCLSLLKTERLSMGRYNRGCVLNNNSAENFVQQYIRLFE